MNHNEIRERFLKFFEDKEHTIVKSSSLIPSDPTMLLTGAGMVQFKPIFIGTQKADFTRAASVQKCVRTTDIENVGVTARHLTFFEMLGNFSFGDYFKEKAIPWCWELLTEGYQLDVDKLWVTIFTDDDEAAEIWEKDVGVSPERIVRLGEKDNFWAAGPTGPCGPCSEVIYDFGEERACSPGCHVGCDCDRFLEIWNLVFMQYDRDENSKLNPLPNKGIDTGMGLERLASLLQHTKTNFETDLLYPLINKLEEISGKKYSTDNKTDTSMKIIADHTRAITFMVGDGVIPSNEGRGYILRRLLRRTIRHGRLMGIDKPFLKIMTDIVIKMMGDVYPELVENKEFIKKIVQSEEDRFNQTLRQGLKLIEKKVNKIIQDGQDVLSGSLAFQLHDTYGFPVELTEEIAAESNLKIDFSEYEKLMENQRQSGRAAWQEEGWEKNEELYANLIKKISDIEFSGYEKEEVDADILAIVYEGNEVNKLTISQKGEIILNTTPFYAEKGGQIADIGEIQTKSGIFKVEDTQEIAGGLILHFGHVEEGMINIKDKAIARIDRNRRQLIARNHTATHLLHWALRLVLGSHVKQSGSFVSHDRLRFDFTHFQAMTNEEIKKVESLLNQKIIEDHPVRCYTTTQEYAKDIGALALFGEKYDEFVRVVESGDFHRELCGGTHVISTGLIGLVIITSESSVGANIRRIEAITSRKAIDYMVEEEALIRRMEKLLEVNKEQLIDKVKSLLVDLKEANKVLKKQKNQQMKDELSSLMEKSQEINKTKIIITRIDGSDMDELRRYSDLIRDKAGSCIVLLGSVSNGKALVIAAASKDLANEDFSSKDLIQYIAPLVGGGGGGRSDLAQAGGKQVENIDEALSLGKKFIEDYFNGE